MSLYVPSLHLLYNTVFRNGIANAIIPEAVVSRIAINGSNADTIVVPLATADFTFSFMPAFLFTHKTLVMKMSPKSLRY